MTSTGKFEAIEREVWAWSEFLGFPPHVRDAHGTRVLRDTLATALVADGRGRVDIALRSLYYAVSDLGRATKVDKIPSLLQNSVAHYLAARRGTDRVPTAYVAAHAGFCAVVLAEARRGRPA